MISPREISVVIQGPVIGGTDVPTDERLTWRAIDSIRRVLPGAEVVLSTWQGIDTCDLEPDAVVFSADPGSFTLSVDGRPDYVNNVNRQITSTLAGLRLATREYVIKLRSDCELTHDGLLGKWSRDAARSDDMRVFENRIVCGELFARDPKLMSFLFHPSDIFHFGSRADMMRLWDIPPAPIEETLGWRTIRPSRSWIGVPQPWVRYVPEQYIWITALRKAGFGVQLNHCTEMNRALIAASEFSLLNNFSVIDERSLGVIFPSNFFRHGAWKTYSRQQWAKLTEIYCVRRDPSTIAERVQKVSTWAARRRRRAIFEQVFFRKVHDLY